MSINAKLWASTRTIQGNAWRWELAYRTVIQQVHGSQRMATSRPASRLTPLAVSVTHGCRQS